MMWGYEYCHDSEYGRYIELSNVYYKEDGVTISYRKYENSTKIKKAGGYYVLYCEELDEYSFSRNDYMAMHKLPSFIAKCKHKIDNN